MLIQTYVFNDFFRIGNRQLVASCRFGDWFSNLKCFFKREQYDRR